MDRPIRLTAVLTHPVQYSAPWFRHIAARCPELDLTVLYATRPSPEQQGVGFGTAFEWDVPLTDGYRCRVLRPTRPGESVHSDRFWGLNVHEIGTAIRESHPDVVLIPGWHSVTLLRALWACQRQGIPVLYRGDTHLGTAPGGWRRTPWALRTWTLLRLFDGYLSVGSRARRYLRRFGVEESSIWDAPHCVDNAFFARAAAPYQAQDSRTLARAGWGLGTRDFVVLFVGKLEPQKRPTDLIRAMARLSTGARLLVVGTGALESACREEAARLGVDVAWAGFINQLALGRAYAAADCLVLPSEEETWGLVVNEAMATGLPCVVSDRVGCAPDLIIPGRTGEVYPLSDVEALAAVLERVRARVHGETPVGEACRERAAANSFEAASAGLLAGCRGVLGGGTVAAPRVMVYGGGMVIVGGTERMIFEILAVLRERGAVLHWIVNRWENHRIVALAERLGASWSTAYHWFPLDRRIYGPVRLAQMVWDVAATSLGVLRDAWRFRPTHVLMPEFASVLRTASALAVLRLLGVRVILGLGNAPDPGPFYRRIWRWGVNPVVSCFVCNSRFTEQELLAHGIRAHKARQIYNTVPSRDAASTSAAPRDLRKVIFIGQIIPDKGLHVLLDAMGLLVARGRDVRLAVVGQMDGWVSPAYSGYRERLLARALQPDLGGRVTFLGWREDVPELLAGAGLHCCPSLPVIREGFGLVNVEAKQAGIPSVVFPTGALPELITHREDGWVCPSATAEALAEGLEYFLSDPSRLEAAGLAARASLARFSRECFAERWWAIFQEPRDAAADVSAAARVDPACGRPEAS